MNNTRVSIRMNDQLKKKANEKLAKKGITLSQYLRMVTSDLVNENDDIDINKINKLTKEQKLDIYSKRFDKKYDKAMNALENL